MENRNKKTVVLSILVIVLLIGAIAAVAYAAFTTTLSGNRTNTITTAAITVTYREPASNYTVTSATPITDSAGIAANTYFEFSVIGQSTGATTIGYTIYLVPEAGNTLNNSDVKLYLTSVSGSTETAISSPAYPKLASELTACAANTCGTTSGLILYSGGTQSLNNNTVTHTYRLRMWLKSDYDYTVTTSDNGDVHTATVGAKTWAMKVNVYAHE